MSSITSSPNNNESTTQYSNFTTREGDPGVSIPKGSEKELRSLMANYSYFFSQIRQLSNEELIKQCKATCSISAKDANISVAKLGDGNGALVSLAMFINGKLVDFNRLPSSPFSIVGNTINGLPLDRFTVPSDRDLYLRAVTGAKTFEDPLFLLARSGEEALSVQRQNQCSEQKTE